MQQQDRTERQQQTTDRTGQVRETTTGKDRTEEQRTEHDRQGSETVIAVQQTGHRDNTQATTGQTKNTRDMQMQKQMDRWTDGQTGRQAGRQTDRHTDRQTELDILRLKTMLNHEKEKLRFVMQAHSIALSA